MVWKYSLSTTLSRLVLRKLFKRTVKVGNAQITTVPSEKKFGIYILILTQKVFISVSFSFNSNKQIICKSLLQRNRNENKQFKEKQKDCYLI